MQIENSSLKHQKDTFQKDALKDVSKDAFLFVYLKIEFNNFYQTILIWFVQKFVH